MAEGGRELGYLGLGLGTGSCLDSGLKGVHWEHGGVFHAARQGAGQHELPEAEAIVAVFLMVLEVTGGGCGGDGSGGGGGGGCHSGGGVEERGKGKGDAYMELLY